MTPHFQGGLRELLDHPLVGEVRGEGLVAGVELVRDKARHEPFDPSLGIGPFCNQRTEDHGLIVRAIGDTISFCPPLIITRDEIEEMIARFRLALDDTWARARRRTCCGGVSGKSSGIGNSVRSRQFSREVRTRVAIEDLAAFDPCDTTKAFIDTPRRAP